MLPKFISWIISFFTICVIWVNHHRLFKAFVSFSHGLFWWYALLLFFCSFIPFPTALLGDYPSNLAAVLLCGFVMMSMALTFSLMRIHSVKNNELLTPETDLLNFKKGTTLSILFGPVLYLTGALLSFIHTYISFSIYLAIHIYLIFPNLNERNELFSNNK